MIKTYRVTYRHPAGHLVSCDVQATNKREAQTAALAQMHAAVQMHGTLSSVVAK